MHHQRWLRTGDPNKVRRVVQTGLPEVERFWGFVTKTESCWLWNGSKNKGYGQFTVRRGDDLNKKLAAHRYAYELLVGPIPDGLDLDHLCRVHNCIRPTHLEPVTRKENLRRGVSGNGSKTHCKRGHEFTPENTYATKNGRGCIACRDAYHKEYWKSVGGPRRKARREAT